MSEARAQRALRVSAVLTIAGLAFMLWSLLEPTALPVVLAMSVGQGLGTLAFAIFCWVVVSDLRTKQAQARAEAAEAAAAETAAAASDKGAAKAVPAASAVPPASGGEAKPPLSGDRT